MTNLTLLCPEGHITYNTEGYLYIYPDIASCKNFLGVGHHVIVNTEYKNKVRFCKVCKLPYFDYQCSKKSENVNK